MLWSRPSIHDLSALADAVAGAQDLQAAFDTVITEVSGALQTRTCILQRIEGGWMLVAQTRGGLRVSISDLHAALNGTLADDLNSPVDLRAVGEGMWTSVALKDPGCGALILLLAGDWTILHGLLNPLAVLLASALTSVREREVRRNAERLLVDGYGRVQPLNVATVNVRCSMILQDGRIPERPPRKRQRLRIHPPSMRSAEAPRPSMRGFVRPAGRLASRVTLPAPG